MGIFIGMFFGFVAWFLVRYLVAGIYTVNQNERAVKTFGRAERVGEATTLEDPIAEFLARRRGSAITTRRCASFRPAGPISNGRGKSVYKVSVATQTINMAFDPETPGANQGGTVLEAVTKDQLNTGLTGQIRYRVSEKNLYAYIFGVKRPIVHVMGYFTVRAARAHRQFRSAGTSAPAKVEPGSFRPRDRHRRHRRFHQ